jgi:catechol 2,3-dioxygenase-like lactoylglutathione lyase family enzyme
MIDHTGIVVSDFDESKEFYAKTLSAIGYALLMEMPSSVTGHTEVRPNLSLLPRDTLVFARV